MVDIDKIKREFTAAMERERRLALAERSISIERVQAEQEATNLARELKKAKESQ